MSRRSALIVPLLAVTTLLALAACGSAASDPRNAASPSAQGTPATAADLVGLWAVEADGEAPGLVMSLRSGGLYLWRSCGVNGGSWRGNADGLFAAEVTMASGACPLPSTPGWLGAATSAVSDGTGRTLLGRSGDVVARLTASGRPTPGPDILGSEADVPSVSDEVRAQSLPPADLPAGITPATDAALVGRWEQATGGSGLAHPDGASISFSADGRYRGSDGCNGFAGAWRLGDGGSFLITTGAQTLIACSSDPPDASDDVFQAARIGFDGEVLVAYDTNGKELNRLRRV